MQQQVTRKGQHDDEGFCFLFFACLMSESSWLKKKQKQLCQSDRLFFFLNWRTSGHTLLQLLAPSYTEMALIQGQRRQTTRAAWRAEPREGQPIVT